MKRTLLLACVLSFVLLLSAEQLPGSQAASTATYDLSWYTIDGGGGTASGGTYTLSGTIGQPDAGVLSGGGYTLVGGFWGGPGSTSSAIHLPLIMR